jgi:hypothetical protein
MRQIVNKVSRFVKDIQNKNDNNIWIDTDIRFNFCSAIVWSSFEAIDDVDAAIKWDTVTQFMRSKNFLSTDEMGKDNLEVVLKEQWDNVKVRKNICILLLLVMRIYCFDLLLGALQRITEEG